jgi:hypothetical protein
MLWVSKRRSMKLALMQLNNADWLLRSWALVIFATGTISAVCVVREDMGLVKKILWILIVLSVPVLGPLLYYIRFKT